MLLIHEQNHTHVSSVITVEFEKIIAEDSYVNAAKPLSPGFYKVLFFLYRVFRKVGISTIRKTSKRFLKHPFLDRKHLFTVMMGLDEYKFKPYSFNTCHCRSIFLFDAWPNDHQRIINFVNKYKIDFVFVTASEAALLLNGLLKKKIFFWIPEGINYKEYRFKDYQDKKTDVLALGRKYDKYHNLITEELKKKEVSYLYEKVKGEIIFPTREEFIEGLADAKISICIPSNITHPSRAGGIETMTIRYLQSMASKCLVVGHAPKEMIELFGYNPVIDIDMKQPVKQIESILNNFQEYIPLLEKNYKTVINHHTWLNRWNKTKDILLINK